MKTEDRLALAAQLLSVAGGMLLWLVVAVVMGFVAWAVFTS